MAALTPEIAGDIVAACRSAAEEIAATLSRAFDGQLIGVTIGEPATYDAQQPPAGFDGAGLAVVIKFAESSAVALLPESSGLLPSWYREPDPTGKSKLSTLGQELSMQLVPASHVAEESHVVRLEKLAEAMLKAELAAGAPLVPITLKHAEKEGQLSLIWPVPKHAALLPQAEAVPASQSQPASPMEAPPPPVDYTDEDLARLPRYARSFLKVQVPVSVNLAAQKLYVQEILDLVPGAIIKFDKSCDELLDLVVCDQPIAAGEVVKVGDKFGLRIRNMILPQEQFIAIKTSMAS
jgi:flagellar motor switch protein FliN/FliY